MTVLRLSSSLVGQWEIVSLFHGAKMLLKNLLKTLALRDGSETSALFSIRWPGEDLFLVLAASRLQNFLGLVAMLSEMFWIKSLYLVETRFFSLFLICL